MGRKRITVSECVEGDVAAHDVVSKGGVTLIVSGTVLNAYIIDKLRAFDIAEVVAFDPTTDEDQGRYTSPDFLAFSDDYYHSSLQMKKIITGLTAGAAAEKCVIDEVSDTIYGTIGQSSNITNFIQMLKSSDEYTYTHCLNTAYYAMLIGKWMGYPPSELKKLIQAGLLHDIGKVRVPMEILKKQGILTRDEFEVMKQHTIWGCQLVQEAGIDDRDVLQAVLLHHERIDGSGYPHKANAATIAMTARIVAVADVFDAMTSDRPYKKAATPFEAFEMFTTVGLGIFDPTVMNTFIRNLASNFIGSSVRLNNGDLGKVVYVPPHDVLRPIITVCDKVVDLAQDDLKVVAML